MPHYRVTLLSDGIYDLMEVVAEDEEGVHQYVWYRTNAEITGIEQIDETVDQSPEEVGARTRQG